MALQFTNPITAEVDTRPIERLTITAPVILEEEMFDAFKHIKSSFFKRLRAQTSLRHNRSNIGLLSYRRMKGFVHRTKGKPENLLGGMFTRSEVAELHEEGGTITPKGGGALAVPMPAALTPTGRIKRKFNPNSQKNSLSRVGDIPGLFPIRKGGKMYLAQKVGKRNPRVDVLFHLERSVVIKPQLGFEKTWESGQMRTRRTEILNKAIDKAVTRAAKKK